jgi:hypothetical protein
MLTCVYMHRATCESTLIMHTHLTIATNNGVNNLVRENAKEGTGFISYIGKRNTGPTPSSKCTKSSAREQQRAKVSRRLPTAAARVRVQVRSRAICGQSSTGAGFLPVFWFPLPIIHDG